MLLREFENKIVEAASKVAGIDIDGAELLPTDPAFGDLATNIALKLAGRAKRSPLELAKDICGELQVSGLFDEVSVAGPGFINLRLKTNTLFNLSRETLEKSLSGRKVVAEYGDPNPFKILHAGHLYTGIIGDAVSNLYEAAGAEVHRVNFGGDIGLHVAKCIWAMIKDSGSETEEKFNSLPDKEKMPWISACYIKGNEAYEAGGKEQAEIKALNARLYKVVGGEDPDSGLAKLYWSSRDYSYKYFEQFYARVGISFEKFYPESTVSDLGLMTVKKNTPSVYKESEGAVIFEGSKYGLFDNVFINGQGLPTYAAKDVGLIFSKYSDYRFDMSLVITGNDQKDYMSVVLKSVEQYAPELVNNTVHMTHGIVKLQGGVKMSSRLGNFLKADDVIDSVRTALSKNGREENPAVVNAAIKYAFLKQGIGGDIVLDVEESISISGNSGPYLQYSYARANKILEQARPGEENVEELDQFERDLLVKCADYNRVLGEAIQQLKPVDICTYAHNLCQSFNRFYENCKVIGDPRQTVRLQIIAEFLSKLQSSFDLLGIESLKQM